MRSPRRLAARSCGSYHPPRDHRSSARRGLAMRALICGAGVGGLSAGIALQRAGFDVEVLERAPDLRVSGFGLNLWPNAGRALNALGLESAYEAISVPLKRYWTIAATGEVMYERAVADWPMRLGAGATGVYGTVLSSMLADALGP